MTVNQINYAKLQEEIRHNLATEAETERHAKEDERIRSASNDITAEYNRAMASHYATSDAINLSHYTAMDTETARSNKAKEDIEYAKIGASLEIASWDVGIKQQEVGIQQQNADTRLLELKQAQDELNFKYDQLEETKRKNTNDYKIALKNAKNAKEANKIQKEYNKGILAINKEQNAIRKEQNQITKDQYARENELKFIQLGTDAYNADTARINAETNAYNAETKKYETVVGTVPSQSVVEKNKSEVARNEAQTGYYNTQSGYVSKETSRYDDFINSEIARNYGSAVSNSGLPGVRVQQPFPNSESGLMNYNLNTPFGYGYYAGNSSAVSGVILPNTGNILMLPGG